MEALVSVIIPVYNVSPYLREALDSVIHQTYKNLEILVIDDGSTDGSGAICDEYLSDPRVIIIHQENHGLSGARNTGLDLATGDYIAFLDPDDAYHPDMIIQLLQALLEYRADISVSGIAHIKTDVHLAKRGKKYDKNSEKRLVSARDALISLLEGSLSPAVWNKLYCRRFWEQLRFPEGYVYEDWHVMLCLLEKCNNIVVFPHVLIYHRQREGSITHTDTKINVQDNIFAFQTVLTYINSVQPPLPPELISIFREKKLRSFAFKYARLYHSKAFLNSPDLENILLKEIQNLSDNEPEFLQKKTNVVLWLFRHCPSLLIPTQACFRLVKSFGRKCRCGC